MSQSEWMNGMAKTKIPLAISTKIMSFRLLTRSMTEPDQKFVISMAIGRITYNPATAAADPVKFRMERLRAIK